MNKKVLLIFNEGESRETLSLSTLENIRNEIIKNGLNVKIFELVPSSVKVELNIKEDQKEIVQEKVTQKEREESGSIGADFEIPD